MPEGRLGAIDSGRLTRLEVAAKDIGDLSPYFIKVGGMPDLIQRESYFERNLLADGFSFILQVDENGYPDGFVLDDYPFGYGALYVYARWRRPGCFEAVVAGFTQFS